MISLGKAFILRKRVQKAIFKVGLALEDYKAVGQIEDSNVDAEGYKVETNKYDFKNLMELYQNLSTAEGYLSEIIAQCNTTEIGELTPNKCIYEIARIQKDIRLWNSLYFKVKDFKKEKTEYDPNALDTSVNPPVKGKYVTSYYAIDKSFNEYDIEKIVKDLTKKKENLEDLLADLNATIKIDSFAESSKYDIGGQSLIEYVTSI